MKKLFLNDFKRGWVVGNFEPTLFKTDDIEVAVQEYKKGHQEPNHIHKIATEITFMIRGSAYCNNLLLNQGEGMIIEPNEANIFIAHTDCTTLVIKYPSAPSDKYQVHED